MPRLFTRLPAAEVNDELALVIAQRLQNSVQPRLAKLAVREQERCDDDLPTSHIRTLTNTLYPALSPYLRRAGINPLPGILIRDPPSNLETSPPRPQRLPRRIGVPGPEHNDVGALEVVVPVQARKVRGR